jgi:chromosome segregation ATPase
VVDAISGRLTTATTELHSSQARVVDLTASVVGLTGTIAGLRSEIAAVQDRYAGSRREVRERDAVIATLRETVRSREAELLALSEGSGQVRSIPRRVLAEHESAEERVAVAADLSPDHRHPDVVDLVDVAVVLPNYEGERKLA